MKKLILFTTFILVLASCNRPNTRIGVIEEKNLTQTQIDSILNEYNFVYDDLTFIDSTSQILFPITTQKSYNRKRYSSSEYGAEDYPRYWNILFYNSINNKTNLLTNSKVRISDFRCNIKNSCPILKNRILNKIGNTDYNKYQTVELKS